MNEPIKIRKTKVQGTYTYLVPAMFYTQNGQQISVPSPFGTNVLEYKTLKEAQDAIYYAGYSYVVVEDTKAPRLKKPQQTDYSEVVKIFITNLGDENLAVRNASIDALAKFGEEIYDLLIESLNSENWLIKYSTILCIDKMVQKNPDDKEVFIQPMIVASADKNNMVKAAAITTLSKLCNK